MNRRRQENYFAIVGFLRRITGEPAAKEQGLKGQKGPKEP
jgi:hypothetical protein